VAILQQKVICYLALRSPDDFYIREEDWHPAICYYATMMFFKQCFDIKLGMPLSYAA